MRESENSTPVVEAQQLFRSFGRKEALSGVTFTVRSGECLALFGPNGAGKTTLLRTLAGLLRPTKGAARIEGHPLPGGPEVRSRIGIVSHHSLLYDALTALENVVFAARLYSVPDPDAAARAALDRMGMSSKMNAPVRSLSRGMQQRVSIARAMVHSPSVVLADEPYSGLDDDGARSLTALLGELRAAGAAMIIVTHNIAEGLSLATHASVMSAGKMVALLARDSIDDASFPVHYRTLVGNTR
ncbi:MAG: heme ABC exporter ATP-binding protein CcmA [Gemmatimonadota bacterium]|nr:heme ABC exporter ATP-binding protein CcmA [Gemmatimonadota bacterium]